MNRGPHSTFAFKDPHFLHPMSSLHEGYYDRLILTSNVAEQRRKHQLKKGVVSRRKRQVQSEGKKKEMSSIDRPSLRFSRDFGGSGKKYVPEKEKHEMKYTSVAPYVHVGGKAL